MTKKLQKWPFFGVLGAFFLEFRANFAREYGKIRKKGKKTPNFRENQADQGTNKCRIRKKWPKMDKKSTKFREKQADPFKNLKQNPKKQAENPKKSKQKEQKTAKKTSKKHQKNKQKTAKKTAKNPKKKTSTHTSSAPIVGWWTPRAYRNSRFRACFFTLKTRLDQGSKKTP